MLLRGGATSIINEREYKQQISNNNTENLFTCDTISGFDLMTKYSPRNKFGVILILYHWTLKAQ